MSSDTTPTIWSVAKQGDLEALQTLLAGSPDAIHQQAADGCTALHYAAYGGSEDAVALLLKSGSDPNARSFASHTPLHYAAIAEHADIVTHLLERGADTSATDVRGRSPLHLAASRGHMDIVKSLAEAADSANTADIHGHCPIELAALYGRTETWEMLVSAQTDASNEFTPTAVKTLVDKPIARGEMMAWYLGHSGWAVRTQRHLFILDYAPGEPEQDDASLVNGRINPAEWGDVTVLVMTTHHHGDHFDRRILDWHHPLLRRIYGWDAPEDLEGFRFTGQEFKRIGNVVVAAIPATDAGSAFLIEADGVSFYHAGDHAAGSIPIESDFSEGIDWLADQFAPVQAAFLPVFGCGLPNPDTLQAGNAYTIERLNPDAVLPMHIGWTSHFYRGFKRWTQESSLEVGLGIADLPGDRFLIRNGTIEQIWI